MSYFVPITNIIILYHYNIITIAKQSYFGELEANETVENVMNYIVWLKVQNKNITKL